MKTSLDYLPEVKRYEISTVVEIIREVVNPEMIILFGSYAKNSYVEHKYISKGTTYEYISDYDFLVITKDNPEKTYTQETQIMDKADRFEPTVNLEIHEIDYINKGLELGQYFFVDIIREGILLHDKGTVTFSKPRDLTREEKKDKAHNYFNIWYPQSKAFISGSEFFLTSNNNKQGLFVLHQATESLYYATQLVFTDYKPKLHNLWKLRKKVKPYSEELFNTFRAETDKNEKRLFELLKQGYIEARYKEGFTVSAEDLTNLIERVKIMDEIVKRICEVKINSI